MSEVSSELRVGSSLQKRSDETGESSELWTQDPKSTIGDWPAHNSFRGFLKKISIEPTFNAAGNCCNVSHSEIY